MAALRVDCSVLEDHDVPGHQLGRERPGGLEEGHVPGLDGQHDAQRLVDDDGVASSRVAGL